LSVETVRVDFDAAGEIGFSGAALPDAGHLRIFRVPALGGQHMNPSGDPQPITEIVHGLNNLLTVIQGLSDLILAETVDGTRQYNFAREISSACDRARIFSSQLRRYAAHDAERRV
jgi:hypothetical protein